MVGVETQKMFWGYLYRWARCNGQLGQISNGLVALLRIVVVPDRVVDLLPLVGSHDEYVESGRNIDEQLLLCHHHLEPLNLLGRRLQHGDAMFEPWVLDVLLGQRTATHHEGDAVNTSLLSYCLGDGEMGRGRWVE